MVIKECNIHQPNAPIHCVMYIERCSRLVEGRVLELPSKSSS